MTDGGLKVIVIVESTSASFCSQIIHRSVYAEMIIKVLTHKLQGCWSSVRGFYPEIFGVAHSDVMENRDLQAMCVHRIYGDLGVHQQVVRNMVIGLKIVAGCCL